MKKVKKVCWFIVFIFVIAQFFGPEKNEGDLTSVAVFIEEAKPSEEIHNILKESCFDCHTEKTRYPWYNSITPINYWMADHVKEGKENLNFSKWENYSLKRKEHKSEELHEMLENKEMPLPSYTWTHSEANLSEKQIAMMVTWAKELQAGYKKELTKK